MAEASNGRARRVPAFLREPLEMAQARIEQFEEEAQRVLRDLMNRGRGRAETFRTEALERVVELQGKAIGFLGVASREQVEELSKEIEKLARRLDRADRARKPARKARGEA
jgi:polyhydroxyalkanoate synthesis regulator phasin